MPRRFRHLYDGDDLRRGVCHLLGSGDSPGGDNFGGFGGENNSNPGGGLGSEGGDNFGRDSDSRQGTPANTRDNVETAYDYQTIGGTPAAPAAVGTHDNFSDFVADGVKFGITSLAQVAVNIGSLGVAGAVIGIGNTFGRATETLGEKLGIVGLQSFGSTLADFDPRGYVAKAFDNSPFALGDDPVQSSRIAAAVPGALFSGAMSIDAATQLGTEGLKAFAREDPARFADWGLGFYDNAKFVGETFKEVFAGYDDDVNWGASPAYGSRR